MYRIERVVSNIVQLCKVKSTNAYGVKNKLAVMNFSRLEVGTKSVTHINTKLLFSMFYYI